MDERAIDRLELGATAHAKNKRATLRANDAPCTRLALPPLFLCHHHLRTPRRYALLSLADPLLLNHDNSVIGGLYDPALLDTLTLQRAKFANLCASHAHKYGAARAERDPAIPSHTVRTPNNFKPSAAKSEPDVRFLPINTHVQSTTIKDKTMHYITTGAPADHVGGFNKLGGTRRLVTRQKDLLGSLENKRLELLRSIAAAQADKASHIPANDIPSHKLRDSLTALHLEVLDVSWLIAMRTATCLSHALGIVTSCYLSCVTDPLKNVNAEQWKECGFLVTVEGTQAKHTPQSAMDARWVLHSALAENGARRA